MSSTEKYQFMFVIPASLLDVPIPFDLFKKEDGSYYTYNEWMNLEGNKAEYTLEQTHGLLNVNTTSIISLATLFPMYLSKVAPKVEIHEGIETDKWKDEDQTNYLWIVSTEPDIEYGYEAFKSTSPLFVIPVKEK